MSIQYLNRAWSIHVKSPSMKLVLMSLADQANADGVCWPSISNISERTCISTRQVMRLLTRLEEEGYVQVRHRRGGDGGGRSSNVYTLMISGSDNLSPGGSDISDSGSDIAMSHKPSINHKPSLSTRATKFPHQSIPDHWIAICNERRPDLDPALLFDVMQTWCEANGKTYKNWDAAWRNWMMKEKSHAKPDRKESRDERLEREQREYAQSPEGRAALAALAGLGSSV